jgi:hypothetical protein
MEQGDLVVVDHQTHAVEPDLRGNRGRRQHDRELEGWTAAHAEVAGHRVVSPVSNES